MKLNQQALEAASNRVGWRIEYDADERIVNKLDIARNVIEAYLSALPVVDEEKSLEVDIYLSGSGIIMMSLTHQPLAGKYLGKAILPFIRG